MVILAKKRIRQDLNYFISIDLSFSKVSAIWQENLIIIKFIIYLKNVLPQDIFFPTVAR